MGDSRRTISDAESCGIQAAAFIQFDLDAGANIDSGRAQAEDLQYELVKFPDSDKIVEALPLDKYIGSEDALGRYPLIEDWMPLTPLRYVS